jgi:hypothetical protein
MGTTSFFGQVRKSLATDFLKTSLYFHMHPKILQKLFVSNRRPLGSFGESSNVFLIFADCHPNGIINEVGHQTPYVNRLYSQRPVKTRI